MSLKLKKFLYFLFFIKNIFGASVTVGSDTAVAAPQATITFDGADNKIATYALMDGGFYFLDAVTSCSCYSVYPIKTVMSLSGGKLFLFKDLYLSDKGCFRANGFIDGQNNSIIVSNKLAKIQDYTVSYVVNQQPNTITCSEDGAYFFLGTNQDLTLSSFTAYTYDGTSISFAGNYVSGLPNVYSIRIRPPGLYSGLYHILMGENDGGAGYYELRILSFNPATSAVALVSGRQYTPQSCRSVAWYYNGLYAAFGADASVVRVINVPISGDISGSTEINASGGATTATTFARDALSWSNIHSKNNLAAGFDTTVEVYTFNGSSSLTYAARSNIGQTVSHLSWNPTNQYIAVGLSSGSDRLRIYDFSYTTSTLTEIVSARTGEANTVSMFAWSPDGNHLAVALADTLNDNVKIYSIDKDSGNLTLERSFYVIDSATAIKWSPDGSYLAIGSENTATGTDFYVNVFNFLNLKSIIFKDANIYFMGDFEINQSLVFIGNCSINSNKGNLRLCNGGSISISSFSNLLINNCTISGLSDKNLACYDDTGILRLENSNFYVDADYEFSYGQIIFNSDVVFSGTDKFIYSSRVTSTINSDSLVYFSNGMTFSYAPKNNNKNLIYMQDESSKIFFDGAFALPK